MRTQAVDPVVGCSKTTPCVMSRSTTPTRTRHDHRRAAPSTSVTVNVTATPAGPWTVPVEPADTVSSSGAPLTERICGDQPDQHRGVT